MQYSLFVKFSYDFCLQYHQLYFRTTQSAVTSTASERNLSSADIYSTFQFSQLLHLLRKTPLRKSTRHNNPNIIFFKIEI